MAETSYFTVNPDNVLQAHRIVATAADDLFDGAQSCREDMVLHEMGTDPVSRAAAKLFTELLKK